MTEEQIKQLEAYIKEVGEDFVTKSDIKTWFGWMSPISRDEKPRLKADKSPYAGVIPASVKAYLPPVEYTTL